MSTNINDPVQEIYLMKNNCFNFKEFDNYFIVTLPAFSILYSNTSNKDLRTGSCMGTTAIFTIFTCVNLVTSILNENSENY